MMSKSPQTWSFEVTGGVGGQVEASQYNLPNAKSHKPCSGFRVQGLGFRLNAINPVQGLGFRVARRASLC